jgi:hypothetical protein
LGATNYRSLRANEARTTQVNFRRLPLPLNASNRHRQITLAEVAKQPDRSDATSHGCR